MGEVERAWMESQARQRDKGGMDKGAWGEVETDCRGVLDVHPGKAVATLGPTEVVER